MRPEGRGPLDSLYFDYPTFEARPVAELAGGATRHPVVIVGAGPVGMTAALTLAKYAVPSVVIECKNTFNDGSRAICIARQSFQIFEQLGAVGPFLDKALGWTLGRSFYRGREILRFEMPHSDNDKYFPMYNLQQQYIERFLWEATRQSTLVDIRWQSTARGIINGENGVELQVASPLGDYTLQAEYLIAADGARSPVRRMLGLSLEGENYEGRYVIADVRMQHDYPTERRALFGPSSNPGSTVLIHKQPDDIWRIDYQLLEGEDPDEAIREANIRARVQAILTDVGHIGDWELEWWSIYTANTLCLDDYRHGRVFFAGDSAHIVPIFGVRGLNNGLADAQNIGWKLGYVLNGDAGTLLLESYTPERRGATLDVFVNASKSANFMTPPTRGLRLLREAALSLALRHEFPRELANPRQMTPYTYADSPLSVYAARDHAFAGGPRRGAACPNARLDDGSYLLEHVGEGFTGIFFLDPVRSSAVDAVRSDCRRLDPRFTLQMLDGTNSGQPGVLPDTALAVASRLHAGPGAFYLLRPDLHVAGRWISIEPDEVIETLRVCLGGKNS